MCQNNNDVPVCLEFFMEKEKHYCVAFLNVCGNIFNDISETLITIAIPC